MAEAQLYPGARWAPLGMQSQPRMRAHDILCYHTMAGYLASTDRYFRITNGEGFRGTESHYGVGGKWGPDLGGDLDGACWQWQDRAFTADANGEGNSVVISVETADNAVRPIQAWTPRQLDRLVDIGWWECSPKAHAACPPTWACHRVGIPAQLIPDTKPGRRGIGYHRQGCPPNIVPGGLAWSRSMGKDCPTQVRIDQLTGIVIPRIRALLTKQGSSDEETEVVTDDDVRRIAAKVKDEMRTMPLYGDDILINVLTSTRVDIGIASARAGEALNQVAALRTEVARLAGLAGPAAPLGEVTP